MAAPKPKSLLNSRLYFVVSKEVRLRFTRAARRELGPRPMPRGDSACADVLRRLVLEYVEESERQLRAKQADLQEGAAC